MKTLTAILACAILAAPLSAQSSPAVPTASMAGDWDVSFTSPAGAATWRVKFEQSADTLRGMATTDFGALTVTDGWVSGNELGFSLSLNYEGNAITLNFTGKVSGDTTQGQIAVPGVGVDPFPFTAVRVVTYDRSDAHPLGSPAPTERPKLFALRSR